jgi:hypothetical protein
MGDIAQVDGRAVHLPDRQIVDRDSSGVALVTTMKSIGPIF